MTLLPLCLLNTSYSDSEEKTQHENQTLDAFSSLWIFYKIQNSENHSQGSDDGAPPRPQLTNDQDNYPSLGENRSGQLDRGPSSYLCLITSLCHYFYIKLDLNPQPQIGLLLIWLVSNVIGAVWLSWVAFSPHFSLAWVSIYFPNPDNVRYHLDKVQNIQRQWTKTQSRYLHSLLSILNLTGTGVSRVTGLLWIWAIKIPTQHSQHNNRKCCWSPD